MDHPQANTGSAANSACTVRRVHVAQRHSSVWDPPNLQWRADMSADHADPLFTSIVHTHGDQQAACSMFIAHDLQHGTVPSHTP